MIVLVSDLHLADTIERATINIPRLLQRLTEIVREAAERRVQSLTLVLLGDIFEILKSRQWLDQDVRPWDTEITARHVATVDAIFASILAVNHDFFFGLRRLTADYRPLLRLVYIPGNHDRPLNTEMGAKARQRLQEELTLQRSGGDRFDEFWRDPEHRLIAKHGHEWDPTNRYGLTTAAFGDAVVIEVILRLPLLVREKLQLAGDDPFLDYLHELDNVRPHGLKEIAHWLLGSAQSSKAALPAARQAIRESFRDLLQHLKALKRRVAFETFATAGWWATSLHRLFFVMIGKHDLLHRLSLGKADALSLARRLPASEERPGSIREYALDELSTYGQDYHYLVCGHTHHPLVLPLDTGDPGGSGTRLYLNTGTWRRVHRMANVGHRANRLKAFVGWEEECLVTIANAEEQEELDCRTFEFHRITRDLPLPT